MAGPARVLVVDDEAIVRDVLARYLSREGFEVGTAADGEAALERFAETDPDLVLLDLMLPRLDGFEVFRRIRAQGSSEAAAGGRNPHRPPVIMLTARGEETDRIVGLDLGADDYVGKPFSPREVIARVKAVLRRARPQLDEASQPPLRFEGLQIDARTREVTVNGRAVALTPKEFDLLHLLASNPRTVFTRLQLLDSLWDVAFDGDPSTVTVHIRRLREKIEANPSKPRRLVTVWGAGYRFEP